MSDPSPLPNARNLFSGASRELLRRIVSTFRETSPLDRTRFGGVAIDVDTRTHTPMYMVLMLSSEGKPTSTVIVTADETGAKRVWRLLARVLRKPRYIACISGGYRPLEKIVGALVTRSCLARRKPRRGPRRRPASRRALTKQIAPICYRSEREIICYE